MTIGQRLKETRAALNVSQQEIVKDTGISLSAYASYENNPDKKINLDILMKICNVLNIYPEWLLAGKGERFIKRELSDSEIDKNIKKISNNSEFKDLEYRFFVSPTSSYASNRLEYMISYLCNEKNVSRMWLLAGKGDTYIMQYFSMRLNNIYEGQSIRESAKKLRISHTALTEYIRGIVAPPHTIVLKICTQENINLGWLLTGIGKKMLDNVPQPELITILHDMSKYNQTFQNYIMPIADWLSELSDEERAWFKIELTKKFPMFKEWLDKNK